MAGPGRNLGDELCELLVREIATTGQATVEEDERLVQSVGLEFGELGRGRFLGAVATVVEESRLPLARLAEMLSEGVDEAVAGRFRVHQPARAELVTCCHRPC